MPILAEALRPLCRGVGEVEPVVDKTDVEDEVDMEEEVVMGKEVGVREIVDMVVESSRDGEVNMVEVSGVMKVAIPPISTIVVVPPTLTDVIEKTS